MTVHIYLILCPAFQKMVLLRPRQRRPQQPSRRLRQIRHGRLHLRLLAGLRRRDSPVPGPQYGADRAQEGVEWVW